MNNAKIATRILRDVEIETGFSLAELRQYRRTPLIAEARKQAMVKIRRETDMSYPEMGLLFQRDHATIMHACKNLTK